MLNTWGPWAERKYFLDKMSLRDLIGAYFSHYSIQSYILLSAVAIAIAVWQAEGWLAPTFAFFLMIALYPLVEYLAHRYVLHSHFLFKHKATAKVWKRIHYDHHQNPHDLGVLFGALYTTLPTIAAITLPLGWLIGGVAGAAAGFAGGAVIFCLYEFIHCVQHLPFTPKNRWLRSLKQHHLAHHFHSERGNFGITNEVVDRVFGTHYEKPKDVPRSPTRFNLGYDERMKRTYPWVAELSSDEETLEKRRKRRDAA